jgi:formate hydrogenlyase transcriptional activator
MAQDPVPGGEVEAGDWRYRSLLEVMDRVAVHGRLEALLPDLAGCLRKVVDFDLLGLVLPRDGWNAADLYTVLLTAPDAPPSSTLVESVAVPALGQRRLTALWERQVPIILHSLEAGAEYPEVVTALRKQEKRSACLLPLVTALGPVGLIGFASSRVGAYDGVDVRFLQHVAGHVAVAIDNVRHYEEALTRQRDLEAENAHWRMLLEINNAVVTNLDVASLRLAIAPSLRRMIPHDYMSLTLRRNAEDLSVYAMDPDLRPGVDKPVASINASDRPFSLWLASTTPVDFDPEQLQSLPEPLRRHADLASVKRACFVPLVTSRGTLGGVALGRRTPEPFTAQELDKAFQTAGQIAIALENALAFQEIAALRERLARENVYLEDQIRGAQHFEDIVGESKALQRVLALVQDVAATDTAVLLLGETGTGKELIARAIHSMSDRRARALVTVNCATSPAGLLESEWFGYEKGAFTGALSSKAGRFELAHQGTLFLDEIGDVPLELQSKLLRVLQEHEIERLGSTRTIRLDFRLIAASNRDLEEMVAKREFRADLYYRLNVFPIRIPPLRERREDIPPLVHYFVQRFAKRHRRSIESVSRETMDALCRWHWPGNVRELQNVVERAVILCQGPTLRVQLSDFEQSATPSEGQALTLEDAEREHILHALDDSGWVVGGPHGAAARLGLKRTTLVSTMRRLGIIRPKPTRPQL